MKLGGSLGMRLTLSPCKVIQNSIFPATERMRDNEAMKLVVIAVGLLSN